METPDRLLPDLVMNYLHAQRKNGKYCDVRLAVGKKYTWTHSSVMCSLSPFISKMCCDANKIPAMGNYKRFSLNSPLTIKLYKKDMFDCFKCLQMLTDMIYGQKIEFDSHHSSHLYALCKILSLPDVLIKLIYNRISKIVDLNKEFVKIKEEKQDEKPDKMVNDPTIKEEKEANNPLIGDKQGNASTRRKIMNLRARRTMTDLKAFSKKQSCVDCSYTCYKPSDLLIHLRNTDHGGKVCSLCLNQFDTHDTLKEHYALHDHPKPFFCTVCDLRFQTRGILSQHLPRHSKETPYLCPLCNKGFKWKHGLNSHLMTHSGEKKFLCDECGFITVHAKTMRAHKLTHSGNLFKCSFPGCTHSCSRKENMKIHLFTHSNDKPFVCEICGLKFTLNKSLKRHALIHSEIGLLKTCPHCPFKALRADNLKAHIIRQHTEKPTIIEDKDSFHKIERTTASANFTQYQYNDNDNMDTEEKNDLTVLADAASSLCKIENATP